MFEATWISSEHAMIIFWSKYYRFFNTLRNFTVCFADGAESCFKLLRDAMWINILPRNSFGSKLLHNLRCLQLLCSRWSTAGHHLTEKQWRWLRMTWIWIFHQNQGLKSLIEPFYRTIILEFDMLGYITTIITWRIPCAVEASTQFDVLGVTSK